MFSWLTCRVTDIDVILYYGMIAAAIKFIVDHFEVVRHVFDSKSEEPLKILQALSCLCSLYSRVLNLRWVIRHLWCRHTGTLPTKKNAISWHTEAAPSQSFKRRSGASMFSGVVPCKTALCASQPHSAVISFSFVHSHSITIVELVFFLAARRAMDDSRVGILPIMSLI